MASPIDLRHLRHPAIVVAFTGWNDAGAAATGVIEHLAELTEAELAFEFEGDEFFDFQVNRPLWTRNDDGARELEWPSVEFLVAPLAERDLVLVIGPEPNLRWREFSGRLASVFRTVGPELIVLLGAMLTDAPHSRPVPVSMTTANQELAERLSLSESDYEGPTGILGVLAEVLAPSQPVVSVWASTPHYVADPPNPKATLALLTELEDLLDVSLDPGELPEEAQVWERQVSEMAADDVDIARYIETLEERRDSEEPEATGDAIAAEFQRYLRRRNR